MAKSVTGRKQRKPVNVPEAHENESLHGKSPSILQLLADPRGEDIEFEPRRLKGERIRKSGACLK